LAQAILIEGHKRGDHASAQVLRHSQQQVGMAIKRPAGVASGEAQARKKMRSGSKTVARALTNANLPADTKKMLKQAVKLSLSTFADERHQYQSNIVKMAGDALTEFESHLNSSVVAAKEKVTSIDVLALQMAMQQQAHARAAAKSAYASNEAVFVEAKMKFNSADDAYKVAMKEHKAGYSEYTASAAHNERFAALMGRIDAIKCEASSKKVVSKLEGESKAFGLDTSLIANFLNVFTKPPAERGEFDTMTMTNLDSELVEKAKSMEARLAELEPANVSREEAVAGVLYTYETSKGQLDAAKAALKEAEVAVGISEKTLQAADGDIKNFAKHKKQAQDEHVAAEKALADFQNGPQTVFKELAQMNKPLRAPEPEQADPEPIADVAA